MMERRALGSSGIAISRIGLGCMPMDWGYFGSSDEDPKQVIHRAIDLGVTFLDTADVYGPFTNEETIGRALEGRRDEVVLATKCCRFDKAGFDFSAARVQSDIDACLTRLRTDRIDLFQTHFFDANVPIEETLGTLDDLVRVGKLRYVGCSNYPAWRLSKALLAASRAGIEGYVSVQPRYNLLFREIETELLPLCRDQGLGVLVYNPIAGGMLSGRYRPGSDPQAGTRFTLGSAAQVYQHRYWEEAQLRAVERLAKEVSARGADLVTVAVAWVLAQAGITSAIIGASRPEQLLASRAAADFELDDELRKACDAVWWELPRRPITEGYR